jgi:hypothetical protein
MTTTSRFLTFVLAVAMYAWGAAFVSADPLPGEFLKFQQTPLDGALVAGRQWYGHDERSTARGTHGMVNTAGVFVPGQYPVGEIMADDFADRLSTPVVHVRWWGSYINHLGEPTAAGGGGVQKFLVAWERDVPVDPNDPLSFSHPGGVLQAEVVDRGLLTPGSGTFTERRISAGGPPLGESLFEYNAELACPFPEQKDTVYWLKIVALNDVVKDNGPIDWGWHNRDWTVPDPLASTPPAVTPGEHIQGVVADFDAAGNLVPRPVWHFQDDAVSGTMQGLFDFGRCEVNVGVQSNFRPMRYIDGVDGPGPIAGSNFPGIGRFSKDLSFELYSIPEPSTAAVTALGLVALAGYGWRRRRRA